MTARRTALLVTSLCFGACSSSRLAPGDALITPDVQNVLFQSTGGGLHGAPPSGAACDPAVWQYFITMSTHEVNWSGCDVIGASTDPASYTPAGVVNPLDASAWSAVSNALDGVYITGKMSCGADLDYRTLTIERAGNHDVTFGDDFYACENKYVNYVDSNSLDNLYTTLSNLP
jgi:hypothetical protein